MKPIVAIVQARMSSTRLPGKIMAPICGKPILRHVIERLKRARLIDEIIVATSTEIDDDIVESECAKWGVKTYRGSLDDVLDRYYNAALASGAKTIVRITADCPLIDPEIVDAVIEKFMAGGVDLIGLNETYPDGLDTEVFSFTALERAWKEARLVSEREHVTPYIIKHGELFTTASLPWEKDLSHMRWTVDDPADFDFVSKVYEAFESSDEIFLTADILKLLESRPKLMQINSFIKRNEGYKRSLVYDKVLEPRVTEKRKG